MARPAPQPFPPFLLPQLTDSPLPVHALSRALALKRAPASLDPPPQPELREGRQAGSPPSRCGPDSDRPGPPEAALKAARLGMGGASSPTEAAAGRRDVSAPGLLARGSEGRGGRAAGGAEVHGDACPPGAGAQAVRPAPSPRHTREPAPGSARRPHLLIPATRLPGAAPPPSPPRSASGGGGGRAWPGTRARAAAPQSGRRGLEPAHRGPRRRVRAVTTCTPAAAVHGRTAERLRPDGLGPAPGPAQLRGEANGYA